MKILEIGKFIFKWKIQIVSVKFKNLNGKM